MAQTNREALNAILHYDNFDRVPVFHFWFWPETLLKWVDEGHIRDPEIEKAVYNQQVGDGSEWELKIARMLGFDDNVFLCTGQKGNWYDFPLFPVFEPQTIDRIDDGHIIKMTVDGVLVKGRDGVVSIPEEIGHTLTDRASWESEYLPRLTWSPDRLNIDKIEMLISENDSRSRHLALYAGSIYGKLRNYWGLVEISYLQIDDPDLLRECVDTIGDLSYQLVENALKTGLKVDFVHFWEDICYNKGALIQPELFRKLAGPHYRRIADLCAKNNIDIISLDCDGYIDELIPVWLDNGVNTMFPIEVGSWDYDFSTMRAKFGKELRGIGNMRKHVLAENREAIDAEVERMKRLVDLGGFVPCPDHRIAPDAEWDLVRYYCEQMRKAF